MAAVVPMASAGVGLGGNAQTKRLYHFYPISSRLELVLYAYSDIFEITAVRNRSHSIEITGSASATLYPAIWPDSFLWKISPYLRSPVNRLPSLHIEKEAKSNYRRCITLMQSMYPHRDKYLFPLNQCFFLPPTDLGLKPSQTVGRSD